MKVKLGPDDFLFANQRHLYVIVTRCEDSALNFGFRSAISAHSIKRDDGRHEWLSIAKLPEYRAGYQNSAGHSPEAEAIGSGEWRTLKDE